MRKTRMGRELRKESIACRPCSLNFDDKLSSNLLSVYIDAKTKVQIRFLTAVKKVLMDKKL